MKGIQGDRAVSFFRLGPIVFRQGITGANVVSYLIIALFSTCMMALINFIQPFLLEEYLGLARESQGAASGSLAFWNELVIIGFVGVFGSLSDKIGRPPIYGLGFIIMAVAYLLFPYAETLNQLIGVRVFFAVGAAAVTAMLATVLADYPQEVSRGKFTGCIGVLNGLGIMLIVFIFSKLPFWLLEGRSAQEAGILSFQIVSGISFLVGLLALKGLSKIRESKRKKPLIELVREGFRAAKKPKIKLAYAAAFVSRGDLAIVGTFLSLWIVQDLRSKGYGSAEALKQAGMIFGISQGAALLWAPIIGYICDRKDRTVALSIALALATVGYCSLGTVTDPTSGLMIFSSILLGIGEISAVIASQALIGEQADPHIRGAVVGWFGIFGAIGILISTKLGGIAFDSISPASPFIGIGIVNGLVFLLAIKILWSDKTQNLEIPAKEVLEG